VTGEEEQEDTTQKYPRDMIDEEEVWREVVMEQGKPGSRLKMW
jgi:hypothetical protein